MKKLGTTLLILAALIFVFLLIKQSILPEEEAPKLDIPYFNYDLLTCNKVFDAEPTDNFEKCLELAQSGIRTAQKRILWAYSRQGDYLDWQQVFNWTKILRRNNRNALALSFALMKIMGDDDELIESGEKGLVRLSHRNHAPANVLLASLYGLEENKLPQSSNPIWLLERAHENEPATISATDLALLYANGFKTKPNVDKGTAILMQAAEQNNPLQTNNIAWFLSTLDDNPFTPPDYAVTLAERIIEDPENSERHTYVDTLAATYAAKGQFELAIETQEKAISLIADLTWSEDEKAQELVEFKERLELYQQKQSAVTTSVEVNEKEFFVNLRNNAINYLLNSFFTHVEAPQATNVSSLDSENNQ
ncbi:hypothetical protein [Glaciecola petra]|uniref:Uncharacterized protein n=1 Tax=Glaciecola petra TaxID=3075602 RepID=A0ABU2ZQ36_9ALTE|nr:hypothetical protein [Aestuariibacter sp. P117]MDT0594386.1 hypothetical protein [Aestuariibacter sp. P117]